MFLVPRALTPTTGGSPSATLLYLWITLGDYLDGFLARATGQYSRMGALLDPVVDRLSALAGVVVCWHFDLLPRWALVVLAVREVVTLVLARAALRRGVDLEISWVGRVATFFVFGGLFWSLVIDSWITVAIFLIGVALGIVATALYVAGGAAAPGAARAASRRRPLHACVPTLKLNLTFCEETYNPPPWTSTRPFPTPPR